MRKILGDLGTMCLGIAAILVASVIISIGTEKGPQLAATIGFIILVLVGVGLRVLSGGDGTDATNGERQ